MRDFVIDFLRSLRKPSVWIETFGGAAVLLYILMGTYFLQRYFN